MKNIQKTPFSNSSEKQEPDRKMLIRVAIKFAVLFFVVLMFDSLFDWLLGLIDLFIGLIHLGMDAIEYSIELVLENTIGTGHYQSEIIIINGVIIVAIYLIYKIFFSIPRVFNQFIRRCEVAWWLRKRRRVARWRVMSLASKIKLISAYVTGISCFLFLITL